MNSLLAGVAILIGVGAAIAQSSPGGQAGSVEKQLSELKWQQPGSIGRVAEKAEFKVTTGYTFLGIADTDKFLKINGNLPQGNSYTVASTNANWFGILNFSPEGYVKDDEKIDPDALLKALKEGNVEGNEQRRKQGFQALILEGWYFPPRYDAQNKRLEWGTRLRSEQDQSTVVNVSTKILGRSGYTSAILVTSPETMDKDLVDFKNALKNFDYVAGEKYSEWTQGDKVAAYGLGALILGGAAAVATKKGFWALIVGFLAAGWKLVAGLAVAALAGLGSIFKKKKP